MMHRCWVPREFHRDEKIFLEGAEADRIRKVLRLRPGDKVRLFNDQMVEAQAQIQRFIKGKIELRIELVEEVDREPPIRIHLIQGIPKGDRMEFIVQKCTELGVWQIMAYQAHRSVPRFGQDRGHRKMDRWRRIAVEAASQSGRTHIPEVSGPWDMEGLLSSTSGQDGLKIILWEGAGEGGLKDVLEMRRTSRFQDIWIAVGPEGGFEPYEVQAFCESGFAQAKLGPRILRTETAGPAATAILQFVLGDLGEG